MRLIIIDYIFKLKLEENIHTRKKERDQIQKVFAVRHIFDSPSELHLPTFIFSNILCDRFVSISACKYDGD